MSDAPIVTPVATAGIVVFDTGQLGSDAASDGIAAGAGQLGCGLEEVEGCEVLVGVIDVDEDIVELRGDQEAPAAWVPGAPEILPSARSKMTYPVFS